MAGVIPNSGVLLLNVRVFVSDERSFGAGQGVAEGGICPGWEHRGRERTAEGLGQCTVMVE